MKVLLLFLAISGFSALWDAPGRASITLTPGCLYRQPATGAAVFIGCYAKAGEVRLGGARTDAAYRPEAGDTFVLTARDGTVLARAPLRGRSVYLPVVR